MMASFFMSLKQFQLSNHESREIKSVVTTWNVRWSLSTDIPIDLTTSGRAKET